MSTNETYSALSPDERNLIDALQTYPRLRELAEGLLAATKKPTESKRHGTLDDVVELVRAAEAVATLSACDNTLAEAVHRGAAAAVSELLKQALAIAEEKSD